MSVEFIGFITNNNSSETIVRSGPVLDRHYIETVAKAHETAGFDRALLAFHSTLPDCLQVGQHVLGVTDRLNVLIAQRPGFTAPTLIARQLAAIEVAGKHADTFVLWGESYAQVRDVTSRVRTAAAKHGRPAPRFSLSVRPILADTEEKAWGKAEEILARATALQDKTGYRKPADGHATAGARRLLALAEQGTRIDKPLLAEMATLTR